MPRVVRPPRLPRHLEPLHVDDLADHEEIAGRTIAGDLIDVQAERVEISQARLVGVRATGAALPGLRLRDVAVERCDLSGALLEAARLERCTFVDCRLSGTILSTARLRHVTFSDCRMDATSFRMADGEAVRFERCDLADADLTECRLPGAQLLRCGLAGAELTHATLTDGELHGSDLTGIRGVLALRGVAIDPSQVATLAHAILAAHGVTVTDAATSPDGRGPHGT